MVLIAHCHPSPGQNRVLLGARAQLSAPAGYTPGYVKLAYPGGDLPANQGVCTDVVIRALRLAGYDLQVLIHQDILKHPGAYPRLDGKVDASIDHRRCPNQMAFFGRFGLKLSTKLQPGVWRPGDIVYWKLPNGLDHCGVISDRLDSMSLPYVIHNIRQTAEEDVLGKWHITGHYRFPRG